ncbi:hypothetical protein HK096_000155, partial [Nowakowskiella sp. JEL0078]
MESITGLKECCLSGFIRKGVQNGQEIKLGSLDCYVARANPDGLATDTAILIFHDVFGWKGNSRFIADNFAKEAGIDCYVPDLHNGSSLPIYLAEAMLKKDKTFYENVSFFGKILYNIPFFIGWMRSHGDKNTLPYIDIAVNELRSTHGVKKIATVGYCWGGRYAIILAQEN